jgi:hypothetical protein
VYSREIDDQVLTLSASGWLYIDTFVLFDYETESLWYHLEGEDGLTCISGNYQDQRLQEFVSYRVRWNQWLNMNPGSKYLKRP